jgi:excinuclease UvrABC nuclease subunit
MSKIQSKSKIISKAIPLTKPIKGVYFLICRGVIVYVGQSSDITFRLSAHVSNRKKEFDSYSYIESNEVNLNNLEAKYIYEFTPFYNKQLPPNDLYCRVYQIAEKAGCRLDILKERIKHELGFTVKRNSYFDKIEHSEFIRSLNNG